MTHVGVIFVFVYGLTGKSKPRANGVSCFLMQLSYHVYHVQRIRVCVQIDVNEDIAKWVQVACGLRSFSKIACS